MARKVVAYVTRDESYWFFPYAAEAGVKADGSETFAITAAVWERYAKAEQEYQAARKAVLLQAGVIDKAGKAVGGC